MGSVVHFTFAVLSVKDLKDLLPKTSKALVLHSL